jgi:hypothetical protein
MEERYIEILKKSSFDELTADEKEIIGELCSNQEEFEEAKHLMQSMESLDEEPFRMESNRVKDRLDSEFKEVYGTEGGFRFLHFLFPPITPFYTKPGLQIAFLILFVFTVYYSIDYLNVENNSKTLYSQNDNPKEKEERIESEKSEDVEKAVERSESEETAEILDRESNLDSNIGVVEGSGGDFMESEMAMEFDEMSIADFESVAEPSAMSTTTMSLGLSDGLFSSSREDSDNRLFLIEPVSASPELLDDLFTTF